MCTHTLLAAALVTCVCEPIYTPATLHNWLYDDENTYLTTIFHHLWAILDHLLSAILYALTPHTHLTPPPSHPHTDTAGGYPTAAEIIDLLHTRVAILSGGRDRQGRSIITFPAQSRSFDYNRDCIRRVVQYLACIPT